MRRIYRAVIPEETRFWLYKIRHLNEFKNLRNVVNESPKGDFSLRPFDQYKSVFVHIPKSAGTSVAKSLFGYLPYHYTAAQLRVIFGRRAFKNYFKFTFVRNPWDRLYSAYSYLKGGGWNKDDERWYEKNLNEIPNFNSFVMDWLEPDRLNSHIHFRPQIDFITDRKGNVLVDFIGYFEAIQEDFGFIASRLNVEKKLAHVNASKRKNYKNVYSPEAVEKVRHLYKYDIDHFDYEFDGIKSRKLISRQSGY